MAPLFERIRYQYWVFRESPVWVSVVVLAATLAVLRPLVKVALVARWMVNPVSLLDRSVQVRITVRLLPVPFAPLVAAKFPGATGSAGTVTAGDVAYPDGPAALNAATR